MRFYDVQIGGDIPARYTSHPQGKNDPGALTIEMDILVAPFALPLGGSFVRIWGVSLETISQAKDFNGAPIKVFAGMQAGFPLANPKQSGLLTQGKIFQAFGNWIGTDMSLDLIITVGGNANPDETLNISWNWPAGTPMSEAIATTLRTAAPTIPQYISISPNLILTEVDAGIYTTLAAFAQHIKEVSQGIIGGDYNGVDIYQAENTFRVFDRTSSGQEKKIEFVDLIGQPTWIEPNTIQISLVMRADIAIGDILIMPPTPAIETAASLSGLRKNSVFQGGFIANDIRHVGNYRQPDGTAWITTINAGPAPARAA